MMEQFCLMISVVIALLSAIYASLLGFQKERRTRWLSPLNVIFAGVLLASAVVSLPVFYRWQESLGVPFSGGSLLEIVNTLILTLKSAISMLTGGGDYALFFAQVQGKYSTYYLTYVLILMVLIPILTAGVALSFFKNLRESVRYLLSRSRDTYIFSQINEKTVTLAEDIRKGHPRCAIVFANGLDREEEDIRKLLQKVKQIDGICLKKDIADIPCGAKGTLYFFAMADNEAANLSDGLALAERYENREDSHLYVFATSAESELLFTSRIQQMTQEKNGLKIRRVDSCRSLINNVLYQEGAELFRNARSTDDGTKQIGAVVVGLGQYGTCMMKTLAWFCQMEGYSVRLDGFDRDPLAEDRFSYQCPELMDERLNGKKIPGEARYTLRVHSGIHTGTKTFADRISTLTETTYVLVALGSDEENINAALQLRILFERMGIHPVIQTVVYDSKRKENLTGRENHRKQAYDITYIGDLSSSYTENVIMNSRLEADALERHLRGGWYTQEQFWGCEYYHNASVAAAMHGKLRREYDFPGEGKKMNELTEAERNLLETVEHRRWNAYMRSEGFMFSGSTDKATRNDLAKMHPDLVPFEMLSEEEKRKDSVVASNQ